MHVVADIGAGTTTFTNAQDFVIRLTGLMDLSNASFNNTSDTIALVCPPERCTRFRRVA
jgi:S-layer protein